MLIRMSGYEVLKYREVLRPVDREVARTTGKYIRVEEAGFLPSGFEAVAVSSKKVLAHIVTLDVEPVSYFEGIVKQ